MDGPTRSDGLTTGQQVQQTDNLDEKSSTNEPAKGRAFNRPVVKLKDAPSQLKKFDDDPEAGRPKQTPLSERKVTFSPRKLSENPNVKVAGDFPARSTSKRLKAREASFMAPDGASFENKKALLETKNTYLTAGLSVLQEVRGKLDAAEQRAERLDPPDEDAIKTINTRQRMLKGLERGFRSNIDDARIMSIKSPADMMKQFERMQTYPENLVSRLTEFSGMDQEELQASFDHHVAELDKHRVDIRNAQLPVSGEKKSESNHTYRDLCDHQELMFTSAIKVARQGASNALAAGDVKRQKKLAALADQLSHQLKAIKQSVELKEGDEPVSKQDKKVAKKLPATLQKLLVKSGMDKKVVSEAFHRVQAHELNRKGWESFKGEFTDPTDLHCKMTSEQVPACDMGKIFTTPYEKGTGVSCVDTENTAHANNLWKSSFAIRGKAVFNGIRHGIVDAAGVASSLLRGRAAEKKAEEVIVAALASKPELYEQALAAAKPATPGKPVKLGGTGEPGIATPPPRLLLTSTSLVTTGKGSGKDRKMQEQQNKAFKALIKRTEKNVLVLDVPGPDGKTRKVKFELKLSRFNIPVNIGGVGPLEKVTSGRLLQRSMNKPAMAELVGKGRDIGGNTDFHIRHLKWQVEQKNKQVEELATQQKTRLRY